MRIRLLRNQPHDSILQISNYKSTSWLDFPNSKLQIRMMQYWLAALFQAFMQTKTTARNWRRYLSRLAAMLYFNPTLLNQTKHFRFVFFVANHLHSVLWINCWSPIYMILKIIGQKLTGNLMLDNILTFREIGTKLCFNFPGNWNKTVFLFPQKQNQMTFFFVRKNFAILQFCNFAILQFCNLVIL